MTVSELIEELKKCPGDMQVVTDSDGYHNYNHAELRRTMAFYDGKFFYDDDGNKDRTEKEVVFIC